MKPNRKTLATLLNLVLLLSLILALPAPALGQGPGDNNETLSTTAEQHMAPAADPPPIDCNNSPAGQHAKLGGDDEIVVSFMNGSIALQIDKLDNDGVKTDLIVDWGWGDHGAYRNLVIYPVVTTADLDGDGKDEVVSSFMDQRSYLQTVSLKNPEAQIEDLAFDYLEDGTHTWQDYNSWWASIDTAAGNLDAARWDGDAAEEVAVAFSDRNHDLNLVLLDGESDGGISPWPTEWKSTDHGRGNANSVNVAVGDLDGDGYDNEIVLAIVDGNNDLQVIILKIDSGGFSINEVGWNSWTDDDRGNIDPVPENMSVTTGDFDLDGKDEIAVAFRDGSNALQIGTIVFKPDEEELQDRVVARGWWKNTNNRRSNVFYVSTASADIDGDTRDEIIVAFEDSGGYLQLVTLDAQYAVPRLRGSLADGSGDGVSVDAGDIDKDGRAEVVVAVRGNPGPIVISYDDPGLAEGADRDDLQSGLVRRGKWTGANSNPVHPFTSVALGDVNGDSLYGDYTSTCQRIQEAHVMAMINLPPYWQDLNPTDNRIAYGKSISGGEEEGKEVGSTFGSSITLSAGFEFEGFGASASFGTDFEQSLSRSWTHGSSTTTENGWNAGEGFVAYKDLTYYVYQYQRTGGSADELARVSVPVDHETDTKLFSVWNRSENGGRYLFPTTWVPAYRSAWKDQQAISSLSSYFATDDVFWGEGADTYDFNGNGTPDYLFAVIAGPQNAGNNVFYRIGFDVLSNGIPQSYSSWIPIWHSIGNLSSGLGAAVTELNGNDTPELVVAWVDNPSGENSANYRVCWDLAADGKYSSCSAEKKDIPGHVGSSTQGAGLDIVDVSGDGRPEMFFGWIDNPADVNKGYYRVGWNLDTNGDSSNWWTNPKEIEGAFSPANAGLGLTVDDMDGNGQLDLVAAWVRNPAGENDWAYSVGEDLDGNAYVDSWSPGHRIPGWVGDKTAAASLASADLVTGDGVPELMVGWIDNPSDDKKVYSRVGKYWELFGGEVNQRPSDLKDDKADDGQFEIRLDDQWWNVDGKLLWRWDETPGNEAIKVSVGGANPTWSVTKDQYGSQTEETSESYSFTVGGEAKIFGSGIEGSVTWGFEEGHSYTVSWDKGFYMEGQSQALPSNASYAKEYRYVPFTYMQEAMSKTGVEHAYMVLDYFVTYPLPLAAASPAASGTPAFVAGITPADLAGITPGAPVIESPTHPDPDAWYSTNTATFTWTQPEGDPAVVDGYRWYMDHEPDTVPSAFSQNLMNAATYEGLSDGQWFLHVRARGDGGDWSETAHRSVRVDLHPPQVEINPDLPYPAHNGGWYNKPVTLSVDATDPSTNSGQAGSGVQAVEFSTDGVTWQPYTAPVVFDTDTPLTTFWARATDLVGHVSEPVSITFGVDLTAPTSVVGPDCWEPDGTCVADVLIDEMGNEYLQLAGELGESLSGPKGIGIQIYGENLTSADEVGDGTWSWIPSTELGAGCHDFYIWAEDGAGNVEPVHAFGTEVVWHPREQPNLSGSRFWATATELRPGDTVDFVVDLRNSGWQEAWVPVEVSVPQGLQVLPDTILGGGQYDPDTGTITWPPRYLWPGADQHLAFSAQVDAAQPAATLDVPLNGLGMWPITEGCPPEVLPVFLSFQDTVELAATVTVDPELPAGADMVPPTVLSLGIEEGVATDTRDVQLHIEAGGDAVWMYLKEWAWSADEETWVVAQESGWLPYSASHPWTLSESDGVKYLGVWLADVAGNVSTLERRSMAFTNLMGPRQFLADGQRIQYRFRLGHRQLAVFNAVAHEGNPDLYVWQPFSGFRPQYAATGTGFVDTVGFQAVEGGLYLVEVKAEGDSTYQLLLAGDVVPGEAALSTVTANTPDHPLTVSNPLSAGAAVAPAPPAFNEFYLPVVMKNG